MKTADITAVKNYWEAHPLLSYEIMDVGSAGFFDELDRIKRLDTDKYALKYWGFDKFKGKLVLDVGCGPGWITVQYSLGGAVVHAVDITSAAVELTKKQIAYKNASAEVREGNAENLPFKDDYFDLVVSSGVLHHTSDTCKAMAEAFRVLKPGGAAKITLYRKGILHSKYIFGATKNIMKLISLRHPGAKLADAKDVDDFIRQYDGKDNPIGIGKANREWRRILQRTGFTVCASENHFFPVRFLKLGATVPNAVHYLLDRAFGTMVYFDLKKPIHPERKP